MKLHNIHTTKQPLPHLSNIDDEIDIDEEINSLLLEADAQEAQKNLEEKEKLNRKKLNKVAHKEKWQRIGSEQAKQDELIREAKQRKKELELSKHNLFTSITFDEYGLKYVDDKTLSKPSIEYDFIIYCNSNSLRYPFKGDLYQIVSLELSRKFGYSVDRAQSYIDNLLLDIEEQEKPIKDDFNCSKDAWELVAKYGDFPASLESFTEYEQELFNNFDSKYKKFDKNTLDIKSTLYNDSTYIDLYLGGRTYYLSCRVTIADNLISQFFSKHKVSQMAFKFFSKKYSRKVCKNCKTTLSESNATASQVKLSNGRCRQCVQEANNQSYKPVGKTQKHTNKLNRLSDKGNYTIDNLKNLRLNVPQNLKDKLSLAPTSNCTQFNAPYIEYQKIDLDVNESTVIQSTMGTGKTTYVSYICKELVKQSKSILYICPNITTINDTYAVLQAAKIQVTKDYKDDAFKIFDVMLCTVDSCAEHLDRDVLIIDEVFSVWEELGMKTKSNHLGNSESLLHSKYNAIQAHKHIFILDRYVNPVIKLFDVFQGNDFQMIHNTYKKPKEIIVHKCTNLKYYNEEIIDKVSAGNGSYLLQGSTIPPLVKLSESLGNLGIDNALKTSKLNKGMTNNDFNNHKTKISSPVISKGVSLSADYVYILDSGTSVGVIGILQMADRARDSTTINIRTLRGNLGKLQEIHNTFKQIAKLVNNVYNERILDFLDDSRRREEYHDLMVLYCLSDTYDLS